MATTSALSSSTTSHKRSSENQANEPEVVGSAKRARLNEAGDSFQVANPSDNAMSHTTSVGTTLSFGNASQPAQPLSMRTVSPMTSFSPLPMKGLSDSGPETAPIDPDKFRFNMMQTQTVASPVLFSNLTSPVSYPFLPAQYIPVQYTLIPLPYGSMVNGAQALPLPPLKLPQQPQSTSGMQVSQSSSNNAQKMSQCLEFQRRGMECMLAKNYDAAVQNFEQCLQADPDEPAKVLNLLGLCVLKDLGVAIASVDRYEFNDFCRQKPNVDFAKAIGALQKALAVENVQPSLRTRIAFNLAMTYLCSGEAQYTGFALDLLQTLEKQSNPSATSLDERYFLAKVCYQCAGLLVSLEKFKEADCSYQKAIRLHSEDVAAPNQKKTLLLNDPYQRNLLAHCFLDLGLFCQRLQSWGQKEARECFNWVVELEKAQHFPNKTILARALFELALVTEKPEEKIKLFDQALGLDFADDELRVRILIAGAELYHSVPGHDALMMDCLKSAWAKKIQNQQLNARILVLRGALFFRQQGIPEQTQLHNQNTGQLLLGESPSLYNVAELWKFVAEQLICTSQKFYEGLECVKKSREILKDQFQNQMLHPQLAVLTARANIELFKRERRPDLRMIAAAEIEKGMALSKNYPALTAQLTYLQGLLLVWEGQPEKAEKIYRALLSNPELQQSKVILLDSLGVALCAIAQGQEKMGDFQAARLKYQEGIPLLSDKVILRKACMALAAVCVELKDFKTARDLLRKQYLDEQADPLHREVARFEYAQAAQKEGLPKEVKAIGEMYKLVEQGLAGMQNTPEVLALRSKIETALAGLAVTQSKT